MSSLQSGSSEPLGLSSDKETGLESSSECLGIHKDSSKDTDRFTTPGPPSIKSQRQLAVCIDPSWNTKYPLSLDYPQKGKHYALCKPCGKPKLEEQVAKA